MASLLILSLQSATGKRRRTKKHTIRQEQVKKVGLGFELPPCLFELHGLQIVEKIKAN
jgi:hypothetical protein